MEHNYELVKAVYQNAQLSKDIINHLIKTCDDANFRSLLADEFAQYHEIECTARTICEEHGYPVKPEKKRKSFIVSGIAVNTLIDKTSTHLAEMMVQGSIMGVIDIKRAIKDYVAADEKVKNLAEKLLSTEQNNIQKMLEFV